MAGELLAVTDPEDDAVESLRSLLHDDSFCADGYNTQFNPDHRLSPRPRQELHHKEPAVVLAQSGKRILIVDADLRKGHVNKELVRRGNWASWNTFPYSQPGTNRQADVRLTLWSSLPVRFHRILPELLMHLRFEGLLEKLGEQSDTLIVDAPPILAVSGCCNHWSVDGRHVDRGRSGRHPLAELETGQSGDHWGSGEGFVFNDLNTDRQRYRYGYVGLQRYSPH